MHIIDDYFKYLYIRFAYNKFKITKSEILQSYKHNKYYSKPWISQSSILILPKITDYNETYEPKYMNIVEIQNSVQEKQEIQNSIQGKQETQDNIQEKQEMQPKIQYLSNGLYIGTSLLLLYLFWKTK